MTTDTEALIATADMSLEFGDWTQGALYGLVESLVAALRKAEAAKETTREENYRRYEIGSERLQKLAAERDDLKAKLEKAEADLKSHDARAEGAFTEAMSFRNRCAEELIEAPLRAERDRLAAELAILKPSGGPLLLQLGALRAENAHLTSRLEHCQAMNAKLMSGEPADDLGAVEYMAKLRALREENAKLWAAARATMSVASEEGMRDRLCCYVMGVELLEALAALETK